MRLRAIRMLWAQRVLVSAVVSSIAAGCGDSGASGGSPAGGDNAGANNAGGDNGGGSNAGGEGSGGSPTVAFELSTSAFPDGEVVPLQYECGGAVIDGPGENISPDLSWTASPLASSYALVMDDLDSGVVHWVVYDLPSTTFSLPEDVPEGYTLSDPAGAHQAELQGTGYFGYFGPCSPDSVNTYRWTIHAIGTDTLTGATEQLTEYEIADLVTDQSLAAASFTGES